MSDLFRDDFSGAAGSFVGRVPDGAGAVYAPNPVFSNSALSFISVDGSGAVPAVLDTHSPWPESAISPPAGDFVLGCTFQINSWGTLNAINVLATKSGLSDTRIVQLNINRAASNTWAVRVFVLDVTGSTIYSSANFNQGSADSTPHTLEARVTATQIELVLDGSTLGPLGSVVVPVAPDGVAFMPIKHASEVHKLLSVYLTGTAASSVTATLDSTLDDVTLAGEASVTTATEATLDATLDSVSLAAAAVVAFPPVPRRSEPLTKRQSWLALYEDLPLRTTRELGDYAENSPLPHLLGDLTETRFPLIRLSSTRFFADDGVAEITSVFVDREVATSWEPRIGPDSTGKTVTIIEMGAPVPDGLQVSASGRGRRDPNTGDLISNPGDLMRYVAVLAGRPDRFQSLREECAGASIRLGVRLASVQSIRSTYDAIADCAGAIWCPGMARRYPTGTVSGSVLELGKLAVGSLNVSATLQDTADILRLSFDVEDATGRPRQYIELTASPQRFGGLVKELTLPWVRSAAVAVKVGAPILQRLAGERYPVSGAASSKEVRAGQWVRLKALPQWPVPDFDGDPDVMVLTTARALRSKSVQFSGETMRTMPSVSVTAHAIALPDTSEGSLEVTERDGIATLTVLDSERHPVADARVSLNGGAPKTTDVKGQVSFPYTPGRYEVAIEAPGKIPQTLTVTL